MLLRRARQDGLTVHVSKRLGARDEDIMSHGC